MYTSIDVKAAEILLERKILRNLDLIGGETVLEVGVIMNLVRLCNMFSYFRSPVRQLKIPHFFYFFRNNPPPNYPKESGSILFMSIMYLGLVLIFSTKFQPNPSTLFAKILGSPLKTPPISLDPVGI